MKKLLFILLLLPVIVLSQTYFSERYNYSLPESLDFCNSIFSGDDFYIIPGGHAYLDNLSFNFVSIIKLNPDGTTAFTKNYGDTVYSYNMNYGQGAFKEAPDGTFYSTGMKREYTDDWVHDVGMIYKFSNDLDTLWTKSIGEQQAPYDTTYLFRHFDLLPNNELIIAGSSVVLGEKGIAILLKTDSLGNELWRQYFPGWPHSIGINVIQTPDGGFAISCRKWTFGTHQIAAPYIVKTDSMGNMQWQHYIHYDDQRHGPMYLQNASDSTIVGAYSHSDSVAYPSSDSYNRDALIKLDLEGHVIWHKKYGESSWNKWLNSVTTDNEGNIITAGQKPEEYAPIRQGYLFKTNADGDSLWYRQYDKIHETYSRNYLYGVTPTSDGGYIAVGDILPSLPDTGNQDVWVLKVDSLGCEEWNYCWVGEKEHIAMREAEQLKIFPNPANYLLNIFVPKENEDEKHHLHIYDLYGRKVEETVLPSGATTIQYNVLGWSGGLYTAIATYKGKITGRAKFVVR